MADKPVKLIHYALDSFTTGTVKVKAGNVYSQRLNYNLVTNEMIFEQGGNYMAIAQPENVDTVIVGGRRFIPVGNAFYEFLGGAAYPLFVEHACTIKEQGASTGFGNTNTSATTSIKSVLNDAGAYKLKLPDEFEVIPTHTFYVRKNGEYHKIKNEQQIMKLFPDKKSSIKEWVKTNHTNFSKQEDVMLLVQHIQ